MGKKSTPAPPDYTAAAEAQGRSSREVTDVQNYANRPTLNTPWGSQTWETSKQIDPSTGRPVTGWSSNITLSPQQQAALDSQMAVQTGRSRLGEAMLGRVGKEFGKEMDWSKFDDITPFSFKNADLKRVGTGAPELEDDDALRKRVESSIYGQYASRLDPQWDRRQKQMRTEMMNQGFRPGDEAWTNEMQDFNLGRNDAYSSAMRDAVSSAGEEVSRQGTLNLANRGAIIDENVKDNTFGLQGAAQQTNNNLTAANQSALLRQQQIAEEMQRRGFSLNETNALLSGQQVGMPQMPGFNAASRADPVNYMGAAQNQWQADIDAYNAKQGAFAGLLGGIGSVASGFGGFGF